MKALYIPSRAPSLILTLELLFLFVLLSLLSLMLVFLSVFIPFLSTQGVVVLNDDNFEDMTQASTGSTTGHWFVKFYAPVFIHVFFSMTSGAVTARDSLLPGLSSPTSWRVSATSLKYVSLVLYDSSSISLGRCHREPGLGWTFPDQELPHSSFLLWCMFGQVSKSSSRASTSSTVELVPLTLSSPSSRRGMSSCSFMIL